jgi:hypothetical protein
MAVCYYHPDRPAIGVCVRCRTAICAACSTRLDGINHCHRCLSQLAARAETKPGGFAAGAWLAAVVLMVAWLILFGLFWLAGGIFAPPARTAGAVPRPAGATHAL